MYLSTRAVTFTPNQHTPTPENIAICAGLSGSYYSLAYIAWAQRQICTDVALANYDGCSGWCVIRRPQCDNGTDGNGNGGLCNTPIIVDFGHKKLSLTSAANGVYFDLDGNGANEHTAWTSSASEDAFLVLDRDGDGLINSGLELFGDATAQLFSDEPNGFEALAMFDAPSRGGNGDGKISSADQIFPALQLWTDINHDGVSQSNELRGLAGVVDWIDLRYKTKDNKTDEFGNQLRWRAEVKFTDSGKSKKGAEDVIFVTQP